MSSLPGRHSGAPNCLSYILSLGFWSCLPIFSSLSRPDGFRTENLSIFSSLASRPHLATSSSLDAMLPRNSLVYLIKPSIQTRLATSSFFLAGEWLCNSLAELLKPGIHPPPSDLILPGHQIASQQPIYLLMPGHPHCKSGPHKNGIRKSRRKRYSHIMGI
jgi:hypothetical protein